MKNKSLAVFVLIALCAALFVQPAFAVASPTISGTGVTSFSEEKGNFLDISVNATIANGDHSDSSNAIALEATITDGITPIVVHASTIGPTVVFDFTANDLNALKVGGPYPINVESTANAKNAAIAKTSIGSITVLGDGTVKVATPTASPGGGTYRSTQTVTLGCTTTGAKIRYTLDGSDPVSSARIYNYANPFSVSPGTTLKAYATCTGYLDSDVLTATYSQYVAPSNPYGIIVPNPLPVFPLNEDGGAAVEVSFSKVVGELPVVLTLEDAAGKVIYTLDGKVGTDAKAQFGLTPAQIAALARGTYFVYAQSPGDANNSAIAKTLVGHLIIKFRPTISGSNNVNTLSSATEMPINTTLTGSDPNGQTRITIQIGTSTGVLVQTGDGTVWSIVELPSDNSELLVYASAPETETQHAIPKTLVGTVTRVSNEVFIPGTLMDDEMAQFVARLSGTDKDLILAAAISNANRYYVFSQSLEVGHSDNMVVAHGEDSLTVFGFPDTSGMENTYFGFIAEWAEGNIVAGKAIQTPPTHRSLRVKAKVDKKTGLVGFHFTAQQMAWLKPGIYTFSVGAEPSGKSKGFEPVTMFWIEIKEGNPTPTVWTIPNELRVSVGQRYQLVKPVPSGGALPTLTVASSKKKVAAINASGVLTAKKTGSATITVTDADGAKLKSKITVVPNSFNRKKPLYVKGKAALFSSTNRLYYKKGKLEAEVFVYNRTGAKVAELGTCALELYVDGVLTISQPIPPQTFKTALKNKSYKTFKFSFTDAEIPGVSAKSFDLGSKRYQLLIRGDGVTPLTANTKGAVAAKSFEALPSSAEDNSTPSTGE